MQVIETKLPGVLIIEPKVFGDARGFFKETFQAQRYREAGIEYDFVQDNHSFSKQHVLRGLHYQKAPYEQGKLIRVLSGEIFDVAVDIRRGSPTFGQWEGYELTAENGNQLYIPVGFAHGFVTLVPDSEIVYKCSDYYAPETEGSVLWNDPDIGIDWPTGPDPILSDKDAAAHLLADLVSPFIFGENS